MSYEKRLHTDVFCQRSLCEQAKPLPHLDKELKWHTLEVLGVNTICTSDALSSSFRTM